MHGGQAVAGVLLALGGLVTACGGEADGDAGAAPADDGAVAAEPTTEARAVLAGVGASGTSGVVRFGDADGDAVEVRVELSGAPPGTNEVTLLPGGGCPSGATSTSGHGVATVSVGQDGQVSTVLTSQELSLTRGEGEFVRGRPVVVTAAGTPVACGMVVPIGRWSES